MFFDAVKERYQLTLESLTVESPAEHLVRLGGYASALKDILNTDLEGINEA